MKLKYHKHYEIDKHKWDETIKNSASPFVYAMSWYLDIVAPKWGAIISEQYDYVMPICKINKFGFIPIISQPILCQQLGVFSLKKGVVDEKTISLFLKKIPFYFLKRSIQFNYNHQSFHSFTERKNYILNCNLPHSTIQSKYSSQIKRNIKKAHKSNLTFKTYRTTNAINDFVTWKASKLKLGNSIINSFSSTLLELDQQNKLISFCVQNKLDEVEASCILIKFDNTLTLASLSSSENGQKTGASSLLLDKIIEDNSSKSITFDFEGSNLDSLAKFYKGFGAIKQTYYLYQKP